MDIGNQQRVIIVELEETMADKPPVPVATETAAELEKAATWPLPLDLDPEPVS